MGLEFRNKFGECSLAYWSYSGFNGEKDIEWSTVDDDIKYFLDHSDVEELKKIIPRLKEINEICRCGFS